MLRLIHAAWMVCTISASTLGQDVARPPVDASVQENEIVFNHAAVVQSLSGHGSNSCKMCHQTGAGLDSHSSILWSSGTLGFAAMGNLRIGSYTLARMDSPLIRSHLPIEDEAALIVVDASEGINGDTNLEKGDVVISMNDIPVDKTEQLMHAIASDDDGFVDTDLVRGGKRLDVKVSREPLSDPEEPYRIGVQVESPNDALRAQLNLYKNEGLLVVAVVDESPAAKAGIQMHDILLRADDQRLSSVDGLQNVIGASGGHSMTFKVMRAGSEVSVEATPVRRPKQESASIGYCPAWLSNGAIRFEERPRLP